MGQHTVSKADAIHTAGPVCCRCGAHG